MNAHPTLVACLLCAIFLVAHGSAHPAEPGRRAEVSERLHADMKTLVGESELNLIRIFGDADEVHDAADGARDLLWINRRGAVWCEVTIRVDALGKAVAADWRDSGGTDGLDLCEYWLL